MTNQNSDRRASLMASSRWRSWLALLMTAGALTASASQAQSQRDEHWPFQRNPRTVWERVMSPQSGTSMFVINDRPVLYAERGTNSEEAPLEKACDGDILKITDIKKIAASTRLSQLFLERALSMAREHNAEYPWDVVDCLVNLSAFYYQLGVPRKSGALLQEAVTRARLVRGEEHADVAGIQDYLAMVCRELRQYDRAEELYKSSLGIRQAVLGVGHPEVAASYMNLAMLYSDAGRRQDSDAALGKAHELMGDTAFVSSKLTPGARPVSTCLSCRGGYKSDLPEMVEIANEIILKHPPVPVPAKVLQPGLVTIVGRWSVPTDELQVHRTKQRTYKEDTLQGEETVMETKDEPGVSPLEAVPIYLCEASDRRTIAGQISLYARRHGLDIAGFGTTWPSVRRQALDMTRMMDAVAQSRRVEAAMTDKIGEYQFSDVPKGIYVLYASLQTESQVLYWMSEPITVAKRGVVTYDFDEHKAARLWTRARASQQISRR